MFDVTVAAAAFDEKGSGVPDFFDFSALEALETDFAATLAALGNPGHPYYAIFDRTPTVSSQEIQFSDEEGNAFVLTGLGLEQIADLGQLQADLQNGIATGAFSSIDVIVYGSTVLSIEIDEDAFSISTGDETLTFGGTLPTEFQEIFDFTAAVTGLLTSEEISSEQFLAIMGVLDQYELSSMTLTSGDDVLLSLTETTTQVTLSMGGGTLTLDGTFPGGNFAGWVSVLLELGDAWEEDGSASMNDLTELSVTSLTLTDINNQILFSMSGDFDGVEVDPWFNILNADEMTADLTILGSDSTEKGDEDAPEGSFLDRRFETLLVDLQDGNDEVTVQLSDIAYWDLPWAYLTPTTFDGGDGFDALHVEDFWSDNIYVLFDKGVVVGFDDPEDLYYGFDFANFERVDISASWATVYVQGDENDNVVRIKEMGGFLDIHAGEGDDRLELHRIEFNDGMIGLTLKELHLLYDMELAEDGSVWVYHSVFSPSDDPGTVAGHFESVETLRLLASRESDETVDYSLEEVLDEVNFEISVGAQMLDDSGPDLFDTFDFEAFEEASSDLFGAILGLMDPSHPLYAALEVPSSVSATEIVFGDTDGDAVVISGSGLSQIADLDQLETDLMDGVASGAFDQFDIYLGGVVALSLSLEEDGYTLSSGSMSLALTGSVPTSFQDIFDVSMASEWLMNLDKLTLEEMSLLSDFFSDYGLTGLQLSNGDVDLFSLTATSDAIRLEIGGAALEITGTFPGGNIGGYIEVIEETFALAELGEIPTLAEIAGLGIDGVTLTGADGTLVFGIEGEFDRLMMTPEGILNEGDVRFSLKVVGTDGRDMIEGVTDYLSHPVSKDIVVEGGKGNDYTNIAPGNHHIDGGDDFDTVGIVDSDSEAFVVDLVNGEIRGQSGLGDDAEVYYTTTIANVEGAQSYSPGDVKVIGTGDYLYFGLNAIPTSLEIDNGAEGTGRFSLRWFIQEDADNGMTKEQFLGRFEIVQMDETSANFEIRERESGSTIATLQGMTLIQFLDPDADDMMANLTLEELAFFDIEGTDDDETLVGTTGHNLILGLDGDDTITPGEGEDTVDAGAGDDHVHHTNDVDVADDYDGGDGRDTLYVDLSGTVDPTAFDAEVDLSGSEGNMGVVGQTEGRDSVRNFENLVLLGAVDMLVTGTSAANLIDLDGGNDTVDAGAGNDEVYAGAGDDDVSAGEGNDVVEGDTGTNTMDGGAGSDTALFAGNRSDYDIDLESGVVTVTKTEDAGGDSTDILTNFERFSFADQFYTLNMIENGTSNESDTVDRSGSSSNENLDAGGGDDTVSGGSGNDTMNGGSGNDSMTGGDGDDDMFDALGNNSFNGGNGRDTGRSLSGNNRFFEEDGATDDSDTSMDDYYAGGYGDDDFHGGAGNDVLIGDRGSAFYFGDDTMTGGTGDDILQGAGGADVFIFRSGDGDDTIGQIDQTTIATATNISDVSVTGADFEVGLDRVDLTDFGYATVDDVLAQISDVGGNAVLDTGAGTITFYDIQAADFGADDFII